MGLKFSTFAAVSLGDYAPGLRPRPNTPDTHRAWKTCAPPRLIPFRFLTETRAGFATRLAVLAASKSARLSTLPAFESARDTPRQGQQAFALRFLSCLSAARPHCKTNSLPREPQFSIKVKAVHSGKKYCDSYEVLGISSAGDQGGHSRCALSPCCCIHNKVTQCWHGTKTRRESAGSIARSASRRIRHTSFVCSASPSPCASVRQ